VDAEDLLEDLPVHEYEEDAEALHAHAFVDYLQVLLLVLHGS
jgi:hypothetical protein